MSNTYDALLGNTPNSSLASKVAQNGVTSLLVRTYKPNDTVAKDFYDGLGTTIGNEIPIIFGEVMIVGQTTDSGAIRSDLDPASIVKVIEFITGEGPVVGIKGVADDKMQNVFVNGTPVVDSKTGKTNFKTALKEIAGATAIAGAFAAVPYVRGLLGIDPKTGTTIPDELKGVLQNAATKSSFNDLQGVSTTAPNDGDVLVYKASTGQWTNMKPSVTGLEVQASGSSVLTDTDILEFTGAGVTTTVTGTKKVTITIAGSSGGSSGGTGGTGGSSGGTGGTVAGPGGSNCSVYSLTVPSPGSIASIFSLTYVQSGTTNIFKSVIYTPGDLSTPQTAIGIAQILGNRTNLSSADLDTLDISNSGSQVMVNTGVDYCVCDPRTSWAITCTDSSVTIPTPATSIPNCVAVIPTATYAWHPTAVGVGTFSGGGGTGFTSSDIGRVLTVSNLGMTISSVAGGAITGLTLDSSTIGSFTNTSIDYTFDNLYIGTIAPLAGGSNTSASVYVTGRGIKSVTLDAGKYISSLTYILRASYQILTRSSNTFTAPANWPSSPIAKTVSGTGRLGKITTTTVLYSFADGGSVPMRADLSSTQLGNPAPFSTIAGVVFEPSSITNLI